jgi:hypothetical protein
MTSSIHWRNCALSRPLEQSRRLCVTKITLGALIVS